MAEQQKAKLLVWNCILADKLENMQKIFATGHIAPNDPISPVQIRPLHLACAKNRIHFVRALLELGADPSVTEST